MRRVIISAVLAAGCAGQAAKTDTATVRDSAVVAGAPASLTPAVDSGTAASTGSTSSPAGKPTVAKTSSTTKPAPPAATDGARAIDVQPDSLRRAPTDSVRGIVSVTGTSIEKHVMVVAGSRRVEITGPVSAMVGHLAGAEVSVAGTPRGSGLDGTHFTVRSVDGQAAIDGILRVEGGNLFIVTANGARTHIVNPPPPLQGRNGARVWITGDPAKGVASFGFIDPPR